jgi:flagellar hook protein FlgE
MLRSLFSGVSGMKSNQTKMDVIGNNIANVNTTAFKSGRVTFKDMLSQTLQSANAPSEGRGGLNPKQVGLGTAVAGIDTNMNQGGLQPTGRATDLAIEGNGFFVAVQLDTIDPSKVVDTRYTRDGSFTLDRDGNLITSEGYYIMGSSGNGFEKIVIPSDVMKPVEIGGIALAFTTGNDLAGYRLVAEDDNTALSNSSVTIDSAATPPTITISGDFDNSNGEGFLGEDLALLINDALAAKGINQRVSAGGSSKSVGTTGMTVNVPGYAVKLTAFGIEADGTVRAVYDDKTVKVGQIVLANFQNPAGLTKRGGNSYSASLNSGEPQLGIASSSGFGNIQQGMLEMSNVDLANEFTDMIITSRAFQANSRTITTSDEMLQELLNLKR